MKRVKIDTIRAQYLTADRLKSTDEPVQYPPPERIYRPAQCDIKFSGDISEEVTMIPEVTLRKYRLERIEYRRKKPYKVFYKE